MQVPRLATTKPFVHVVPVALTKGPVTVMAGVLKVIETPVLLVRVILLTALLVPTAVVAKLIEVGDSDTLLVPVPETPMICGVVGSLSLMITAPFFVPVVVGVKVRLMTQLAFAARLWPEAGQVLEEMAKSVVSLSVIAPMVIAVLPLFLTVTLLTALVVFFNWLPKLTGAPVRETAVAVPDKAMVETVLKKPLSLMVSVPVRIPPALGAKKTYIVQVAVLGKLEGQSSDSVKSPLMEMLLIVKGPTALRMTC